MGSGHDTPQGPRPPDIRTHKIHSLLLIKSGFLCNFTLFKVKVKIRPPHPDKIQIYGNLKSENGANFYASLFCLRSDSSGFAGRSFLATSRSTPSRSLSVPAEALQEPETGNRKWLGLGPLCWVLEKLTDTTTPQLRMWWKLCSKRQRL